MAGGTAKGTAGGAPPRKADPWKVAFIVLLIVALLAAAGYLLLGSRLLVVREVAVSGLHRLDRDEVVRALAVPTGTPLARVDTEAAAERVAGLRLAESARVERGWPAELRVRVEERTPKLAVGAGGGYRLVDQDGVRISDTEALPEEYPLASVRGEVEGNGGSPRPPGSPRRWTARCRSAWCGSTPGTPPPSPWSWPAAPRSPGATARPPSTRPGCWRRWRRSTRRPRGGATT
ncbi:cell division protein FtsQ/DivIB [Nocardiopsis composta]